jgi:pyruvate dehydrogenase E2 component (dihydrolipoamide acetyltransferase)
MSATASSVEVPDIGDFDEVPVIEILVAVGDTVAAEDPLVTLESDKATMDVPAPFGGVVREITVKVGDQVKQGSPLMTIESGDADGDGDAGGDEPAERAAAVDQNAEQTAAPSESLEVPEDATESSAPAPVEARNGGGPEFGRQAELARTGEARPIYASPSARRLARELGVALSDARGSGRKGRITKDDVQAMADGSDAPAAPSPSSASSPVSGGGLNLLPWPTVDFAKYGEVERVTRTRIQKISAPNLARNWVMIPHVTHNDEADITELEAWRKRLNEEHARAGVKFTMVSFLIAACVAALKEFPIVNSSLDGDELVLKRYYNIGFAADTPNGLVVPVIKNADTKGLVQIAQDLTELSGKARDGKLSPGDMSGASFTISSLGGIGGTSFTPIINAPEVAILGVTRAAMKPVWNGSSFDPRLMVPLSLSYDHRVIDGAAAARFTAYLASVLSDLRRVLL